MIGKHENIMVPEGFLAWIYLHSENQITSVDEHWHRDLELTLTLHGEITYHINGNKITTRKNDLILINSGQFHSCDVKLSEPCEALNIIFPYEFLKMANPNIDRHLFQLDCASPQYVQLISILNEAYFLFKKRFSQPFYQLKLNSIFYNILYLLMDQCMVKKRPSLNIKTKKYWDRCQNITQYIENHYHEPLTLKSVSFNFGISKEHLARTFKEYMDTTFKTYLTQVRLFHAYQLLAFTDLSLLQISMHAGFTDSRSLIHCFKNMYGVTPQKYRKHLVENNYLLSHKKCIPSHL